MINTLVTCGGGFQGLGMVRALRALHGVRVTVCDVYPENPTRYACHEYIVSPPLAERAAFAGFLLETVRQRDIAFVFPATAMELRALTDLQVALQAAGAIAAVSPRELLDRLLDKQATRLFLEAAGLPAETSIDPLAHDFAFPLIGKPRHGWGGRDNVVAVSRQAATHATSAPDAVPRVWSRRFEAFDEYSADFAIAPTRSISPLVVRRRVRTSGGFAVVSESIQDPELGALFERVAGVLASSGGLGCFNAQVIAPCGGDAGAPFISDINPRLGTSATHALGEGVNLPGFFMASARAGDTTATRKSVRNVRLLQDIAIPRLSRRPRAVVLDLDDTLVDHKRWMYAKMEALHARCFSQLVDAARWRLIAAQLIDEHDWPRLIDRALELLSLPDSMRSAAIETYRAIEVDTPLFDDVATVLDAFADAGIRMAILTDNPPTTQRAKIAHAPPLARIETVILTRELGREKPHGAGFAAAADALGLPADELVMVGDNWFRDGIGAIAAGYAQALIVRRDDKPAWQAGATPAGMANRIHLLPDLVCVQHACLDAPA